MRTLSSKVCLFWPCYLRPGRLVGDAKFNISRLRYDVGGTIDAPSVCVVGGGPAGFGIAQYLLKNHNTLRVHMLEKCPIPYGLVRYGVSPDHQDVKNCIHGYEKVAENPRFFFYGGVEVGDTVSLTELSKISDATVLCTGAQKPLQLGIAGENLINVFSAKEMVGWYNGEAEYEHVSPDLTGETAVIIGVGNVALDCARILLKPSEQLKETDITSSSLNVLQKSNIKNVVLVGRRGPLQMSCTRRELAEVTELDDVLTETDQKCFTEVVKSALAVKNLKRRKTQRLVKHLIDASRKSTQSPLRLDKKFTVKLLHSPIEVLAKDGKVDGILLQENEMSGDDAFSPRIIPIENFTKIQCSLVISAIGYGNEPLNSTIPFLEGRIPTTKGRIDHPLPLYACGWCKTGARGVLGDTVNDCLVTGGTVVADLLSARQTKASDKNAIENLLSQRNVEHFQWKHWKRIDGYETNCGVELGKVREKVVSWEKMRNVAFT